MVITGQIVPSSLFPPLTSPTTPPTTPPLCCKEERKFSGEFASV